MHEHELIFGKIKNLLIKILGNKLNIQDDGKHIFILEPKIWFSVDEYEITIGYGMNHKHYHSDYDSLRTTIDDIFDLLTQNIRIIDFYKGEFLYKTKAEVGIFISFFCHFAIAAK